MLLLPSPDWALSIPRSSKDFQFMSRRTLTVSRLRKQLWIFTSILIFKLGSSSRTCKSKFLTVLFICFYFSLIKDPWLKSHSCQIVVHIFSCPLKMVIISDVFLVFSDYTHSHVLSRVHFSIGELSR